MSDAGSVPDDELGAPAGGAAGGSGDVAVVLGDGGTHQPGAVRPIERPTWVSDDVWRRALTVYQLYWDREGLVATPEQAHKSWDRIKLEVYQKLSLEPEFQRALELRGIELDPTDSLSDLQVLALMKLTDPGDKRTARAKLRDLGISWPRYQGWLNNPVFAREKRERTERTFADVADLALMKLHANVDAGNQSAIEFALEVTGRYNRSTIAIQDARLVVQTLVEVVIKNADAATRDAILQEAKAIIAGFDLNNRKALGG